MRTNSNDSYFELQHARDSNAAFHSEFSSSKTFSEGIVIAHEGPVREFACKSLLEYGETPKNYKESVRLALRMVPHEYLSALVVDCGSEELRYFQEVRFKPKWSVRGFEETVFSYPKEALKRYVSTVTYDRDSRPRTFVSGLTVSAVANSADLGQMLTPPPSPESEVFQNGSCGNGTPGECFRFGSAKGKMEVDENANLFCATKDFAVNGV